MCGDSEEGVEVAISDEYKKAVIDNKITRVRIMLKDSLLLDPTGREFDEMLKYVEGSIPDFIDVHDGEIFKTSDEWNEDYMNDQMVTIVNNFSSERAEHLKKIVNKLYGKKSGIVSDTDEKNSHISDQREKGLSSTKKIGIFVTVLGAGVLIGGLIAAEAPIVIPIIGGVMIGVGAILVLKK